MLPLGEDKALKREQRGKSVALHRVLSLSQGVRSGLSMLAFNVAFLASDKRRTSSKVSALANLRSPYMLTFPAAQVHTISLSLSLSLSLGYMHACMHT